MASSRSSSSDGKLNLAYNSIEAPLEHWHLMCSTPRKTPRIPAFEDEKVQFLTNVKGYVDGLAVSFEPRLKPLVFTMRPDVRLPIANTSSDSSAITTWPGKTSAFG